MKNFYYIGFDQFFIVKDYSSLVQSLQAWEMASRAVTYSQTNILSPWIILTASIWFGYNSLFEIFAISVLCSRTENTQFLPEYIQKLPWVSSHTCRSVIISKLLRIKWHNACFAVIHKTAPNCSCSHHLLLACKSSCLLIWHKASRSQCLA
jgi:hypothetical protein